MNAMYSSEWLPGPRLLRTRINGSASLSDVLAWKETLHAALDSIPDNSDFRILVDLLEFEAGDLTAHKAFRVIVPETLAAYGWRAGYLGLFPEVLLPVKLTRGMRCVAAAHVHHDETKIGLYERRFRTLSERFFTDRAAAADWIASVPMNEAAVLEA